MVFLDSTVLNVALPRIAEQIPSTRMSALEAQSYVFNGYLLAFAALLVLAGALSDFYGRRRMFAIGLAAFGATSVLCGLAPTIEALIAFRVLQGVAGAFLAPGSLAILSACFSGEEQGRAFGLWASASTVTSLAGPLLGGFLVDVFSWRAAFLINVPLVAVAMYATIRYVFETRDESASRRVDWLGAGVVAIATGGITYGLIRGQQQSWGDLSSLVALAAGGLALIAFPFMMRHSQNPLVPLSLFRSRNFSVTNASTFLIYGALYVCTYYLVIHLQGTLGYTPTAAGFSLIPGFFLLAVFSPRFGALAGRHGSRVFMALGPAVAALGVGWLARIPAGSSPWLLDARQPTTYVPPAGYLLDVLPGVLLFGAGTMIFVAPLISALMASVPPARSGLASAINNAVSRTGPQILGALIFIAITAVFYGSLAGRGVDVSSPDMRRQLAPLNPPAGEVSDQLASATREASAEAFTVAMLISAGLFAAGAVVNGAGIVNPRAVVAGAPPGSV